MNDYIRALNIAKFAFNNYLLTIPSSETQPISHEIRIPI